MKNKIFILITLLFLSGCNYEMTDIEAVARRDCKAFSVPKPSIFCKAYHHDTTGEIYLIEELIDHNSDDSYEINPNRERQFYITKATSTMNGYELRKNAEYDSEPYTLVGPCYVVTVISDYETNKMRFIAFRTEDLEGYKNMKQFYVDLNEKYEMSADYEFKKIAFLDGFPTPGASPFMWW